MLGVAGCAQHESVVTRRYFAYRREAMRIRAALVLLPLLSPGIGLAETPKGDSPPKAHVSVRDGRMSVRLDDAVLRNVVADVAHQTGAEVKGTVPDDRTVSASFDDAPLDEGLRRLLGTLSFALVYEQDGRLRTIELRGGPRERVAPPAVGGDAQPGTLPSPPGVQEATDVLRKFAEGGRPIPVRGRLARALGAEAVPFTTLVQAAVDQDDPRVRADALRTGLRAIESDRDVREAFTTLLDAIGDDELVQVMRNMAKDRVVEFTNAIARGAHEDAVKARATSIVKLVGEGAPAN
jgi:hypothetical protein